MYQYSLTQPDKFLPLRAARGISAVMTLRIGSRASAWSACGLPPLWNVKMRSAAGSQARDPSGSAPGEYRAKSGLNQYASHFGAFISLNFDPALFNRAAGAADFLHRFG